jgi:integrase
MLPKPKKLGARGHHAAMRYAELAAFMAQLAETEGAAASALAFTVLTVARSGETLGATWDEIDFKAATWIVPASRMKMGKPHSVPLSDAALDILLSQETARGKNPYVFPGGRPRQPAQRHGNDDGYAQAQRWRIYRPRHAQRGAVVDGRQRRRV